MKWLAIAIVMCLILIPFSVTAIEQDNLIINGTFDENMDGWDVETSQNFSITSDAGVCNVDTTHTDWLYDVNSTLTNATTYNMTVYGGDPSNQSLTHYSTVDNTTYELLNDTFDNYSMNGWEYTEPEDEHLALFLRQNYNETYNLSEKVSLGVESVKLHKVTDFYTNFSTEPDSIFSGNASTDIVWRNNQLECNITTNRSAVRMWNITEVRILSASDKYFGMSADIISNESGLQEINSWFSIGFSNIDNINIPFSSRNTIKFTLMRYNTTHMGSKLLTCNSVGNCVATAHNTPNALFNYSNFTNGITIEIHKETIINAYIKDSSTGYILANHILATSELNYTLNTIMIENFPVGSKSISSNITRIESWIKPNSLPSTAVVILEKTIPINESVKLNINTNRLHYHDPQAGLVKSSITINTSEVIEEISNETTTSTSGWFETNNIIIDANGNITLTNWNSFSMTEGSKVFPAKGVYYDNITIEAIEYDSNASYTSQIFDREYYSDWRTIEVYFNTLDGDYPIPIFGIPPFDTIFNVTVYTRVGEHSIIDGTWSNWDETSDMFHYVDTSDMLVWDSVIDSKNGRFIQYKYEVYLWKRGLESPVFISSAISSVPLDVSTEWGSIEQTLSKPYTNYTLFNYKYKIDKLENIMNGTIGVYINNTLINQHNYTFLETNWQSVEINLPNEYNNSGVYNIKFIVITVFNSTNGTSTILLDNIEFLIESQAPRIIDVNVFDIRDCPDNNCSSALIGFNGTFIDYSRGSDYEYLGLDGIQNVTINVAHYTFNVTNIQYLGNGTFYFIQAWENTPSVLTTVYKNVTFTVIDTDGLSDMKQDVVKYPTIMDFLLSALIVCLFVIIIMMIINKHLVTDTKGDYLPEMISGKKGR